MFRFSIVLFFILGACTSKPAKVSEPPPVPHVAQSWRESFPTRKPDQSPELFAALKSAGVSLEKKSGASRLRAYEVTCVMKTQSEHYECSFQLNPDRGQRFRVARAESEKLANLLFSLPVSQGDSGVSTRFVECTHYSPQETSQPTCSVAIDLDYVGP
jgi:hypothetical protein